MSADTYKDAFHVNLLHIEQLSKEANHINELFKDFFNKHKIYITLICSGEICFQSMNYKMTFTYETRYGHQFGGLLFSFNESEGEVHCSIDNLIEFALGLKGSDLINRICDEERMGLEKAYQIILIKHLDSFFVNYNHGELDKIRTFLKSKYPFYN